MAEPTPTKLTSLQLELLKIFSHNPSEGELRDIKRLLSDYFAEKLQNEVDQLWQEKNISNDTMKAWIDDHFRRADK